VITNAVQNLISLSSLESEMTVLLGQIFFTNFIGSGFQFIPSPSVPVNIAQIFRKQIVETYWEDHAPPPRDWRAVYILQLEPCQTIFGWAYNDGRDDYGRDDVPYFFGYYLGLPFDKMIVDLIIAFLGKGPGNAPNRQAAPPQLEDIAAPDLWNYIPQRPGVIVDSMARENIYKSLLERRSVKLFVVAPPESLVLVFDEQIFELITLLLAQYIGPYATAIIRQLPSRIRFWYYLRYNEPFARTVVRQAVEETANVIDPEQRVLQVIDRLAAALEDELSKAEFTQRVKDVLGIVGP
jgi:hypothetical protein